MNAHPTPSDFEARTNATYDALMWALARPGLPRTLPVAGHVGIIEALIDRECAVYTDDSELQNAVQNTGAQLVDLPKADHLFLTQPPSAEDLRKVAIGSDLYPDAGATLVLPADFGSGQKIRISGTGVDGSLELLVAGIDTGFWKTRQEILRYPTGFELFLLQSDQIIGIPRSTKVEVL